MQRDRAAYMREYRERRRIAELTRRADGVMDDVTHKATDMTTTKGRIAAAFDMVKADIRIKQLEEEVRHLKAELAKRPAEHPFNSRPFTPVPKR